MHETADPVATTTSVENALRALGGWRADILSTIRRWILEAEPEVEEACKWAKASQPLGVPTWSRYGMLCTGEAYKKAVKLTFMHGAALDDPQGLFNSSMAGGTRRAIDITEGQLLDESAFKALIVAAVADNLQRKRKP